MNVLVRSGRLLQTCFLLPLALACSGATANVPVTGDESVARCREALEERGRIHTLPNGESDGGDPKVQPEIESPEKLEAPPPRFPRQSRLRWGEVRVRTVIDTEGRVACPEVVAATAPQFARAMLEVLPEWRFRPAFLDGRPVAVYYELTTTFRLARAPRR